jgi:hypothetical protein
VVPEGFEALYNSASVDGDHRDGDGHTRVLLGNDDEFEAPAHLESEHHEHHHTGMPTSHAGLALLAGFLFMIVFEVWHHRYEHSSSEAPLIRSQLFECKVRSLASMQCEAAVHQHIATVR